MRLNRLWLKKKRLAGNNDGPPTENHLRRNGFSAASATYLIYCRDHRCSHHVETSADGWADDARLNKFT